MTSLLTGNSQFFSSNTRGISAFVPNARRTNFKTELGFQNIPPIPRIDSKHPSSVQSLRFPPTNTASMGHIKTNGAPKTVRSTTALNMNIESMFAELFGANNNRPAPETTTFEDVAGVKEAKIELQEVIDFLKDPEQFNKIGATIPKGVLLSGPPGTGKTLLAKAVAGEAKVPFFAANGSQFVEMYVGMGAKRVRELFKKAKDCAPSIVFIDEIDAVGKKRSSGEPGSNDEREQTLNQLLTEMNGFEDSNVIVLAATNRPDMLDDALLRPGRFDRKVTVDLPDLKGREDILAVHAKKVNMADNVDLKQIATRTPGFAGADLRNLINEAAILAIRNKRSEVTMADLSNAIDRVLAGPEKIDTYLSEDRKRLVAYHEAGHAIVGHLLPDYDGIEKISIVPRGKAAGLTWFTPNEQVSNSGLATVQYLKGQIAAALGGRIAEELAFGKDGITTGASNDLGKVTQIARQMVECYAMGGLEPMNLQSQGSFGMSSHSESLAKEIDDEVRKIVREAYNTALTILTENLDKLDELAQLLIEKETVEGSEFRRLMDPTATGGRLQDMSTIADLDTLMEQAAKDIDTSLKRWSDMEINPASQNQPDRKLGFKRD